MVNGNDYVLQDTIRKASALRYGISGPMVAVDLVWQQKKNIGMILVSTAFLTYNSYLLQKSAFKIWKLVRILKKRRKF